MLRNILWKYTQKTATQIEETKKTTIFARENIKERN